MAVGDARPTTASLPVPAADLAAMRAAVATMTPLRDASIAFEPLPGGLTNRNYLLTTPRARYVARVSPPDPGLLSIDRDHEYRNSVAAAETGVGAPVLGYAPEQHVLVVGYLDGRTLDDADLCAPGMLGRLAQACRRLHDGPRFGNDFDMFVVQARYLEVVRGRGIRLPRGYLDHADAVERIRRALSVRPTPTVPCNNDLLSANMIDTGDTLHLIDYEYAGNNDPCFELGNIWSECHLDLDRLEALVGAYYGRPLRNRVARAQLQGQMSRYGWTLWAAIQSAVSDIEFDFWSWGMEKYDAADAVFRGPDFATLLHDVTRPD